MDRVPATSPASSALVSRPGSSSSCIPSASTTAPSRRGSRRSKHSPSTPPRSSASTTSRPSSNAETPRPDGWHRHRPGRRLTHRGCSGSLCVICVICGPSSCAICGPWFRVIGVEGPARPRRARAGQAPRCRLQRAATRGSAGRLLVQPLQRLRRQGPDARLRHVVRARCHPPACPGQLPQDARGRGVRARRCCSTSTTGSTPIPMRRG